MDALPLPPSSKKLEVFLYMCIYRPRPLVWCCVFFFLNESFSTNRPRGIAREEDIQKMLSAQVHIGTRNSDSQMQDYIWRRRQVQYDKCVLNVYQLLLQ